MSRKTKATDAILGEIHGKVAGIMLRTLDQTDGAEYLLDQYREELPEEVIDFLEKCSVISPALLKAVTQFLKDNSITCAIEDSDEMSELQKRLAEKKVRKRIGNVVPIEE